jgi:hypothetical protein
MPNNANMFTTNTTEEARTKRYAKNVVMVNGWKIKNFF